MKIKNAPGYYYQTLEDTVKIVASSTMGLTLQCAKCHTHKYDPITQAEYYRVQAVFMSGYRPAQWVPQVERKLDESTAAQDAEAKAHNAQIDAAGRRARRDRPSRSRRPSPRGCSATAWPGFPSRFATTPARHSRPRPANGPRSRNTSRRKFAAILSPPEAKLPRDRSRRLIPTTRRRLRRSRDDRRRASREDAHSPRSAPSTTCRVNRRRRSSSGATTPSPAARSSPGVLRRLATPRPFAWSPPRKDATTSGRRLAFAKWLTQPGHPLTARVMVNRIWLLHFGEGIVSTPDNFGNTGAPPSHPELLDWLATEFVAQGWSIKAMHRLILTSTAYRQSSRIDPSAPAHARAKQADPGRSPALAAADAPARGRAAPRRDARGHRDVESPRCTARPCRSWSGADGEVVAPDDAAGLRRSIYLKVRRSQPLTLLQSFDQPVMETNCTRRGVSTVASQALNLLNSDILTKQAKAFAARVESEAPDDPAEHAVRLALGRPATDRERSRARRLPDRPGRPPRPVARRTKTRTDARSARQRPATSARRPLPDAPELERVCVRRLTCHDWLRTGTDPCRLDRTRPVARRPDSPRGLVAPGRRLRRDGPGCASGRVRRSAEEPSRRSPDVRRPAPPAARPARAKAVIQLFMHGGPSHVDLLDPKPMLAKYDGQPPPKEVADDEKLTGNLLRSPYRFARHGGSGLEFSETLPHIARHADRHRRGPLDVHRCTATTSRPSGRCTPA